MALFQVILDRKCQAKSQTGQCMVIQGGGENISVRGFQVRSSSSRSASLTFRLNHCLCNLICIRHAAVADNFSAATHRAAERCQSPLKNHGPVERPAADVYLSPIWHQTARTTKKRVRSSLKNSQTTTITHKQTINVLTNDEGWRQGRQAHRRPKHWVKFIRRLATENQFWAWNCSANDLVTLRITVVLCF